MAFADKVLVCRGCGREFVFTAGEQQFYQAKGLLNEPGRCPECRAARKASRLGTAGAETGEGRPRRAMYPAVCAACGAEALVPFLPRGDRPVYCSACFARLRGSGH